MELSDIILEQMGGVAHLKKATGGKFVRLMNGVEIYVARQSRGLCKLVVVEYDYGSDLYSMTGYRIYKGQRTLFKKYDDVYFDQLQVLFERLTGYYIGKIFMLNLGKK
jgi:hypothetical protein